MGGWGIVTIENITTSASKGWHGLELSMAIFKYNPKIGVLNFLSMKAK